MKKTSIFLLLISFLLTGCNEQSSSLSTNTQFYSSNNEQSSLMGSSTQSASSNNDQSSLTSLSSESVSSSDHKSSSNTPIKCFVTYDANGGQFEGGLTSISTQVVAGSLLNYPPTPFKTGYSLKVDASERPIWENNGRAWSFSSMVVNEDMTLKCLWDMNEYTISYDCDGGTNSSLNPSSYTIIDEIILEPATKEGCSFAGWADDAGNIISKIEVGSVGNLILKAQWTKNQYLITANSDDSVMGDVSGSGLYPFGDEIDITANPKPGYEFDYWSIDEDDSITYSVNPLTIKVTTNPITYIAHFKIVTYSISYDYQFGWLKQGSNPTSYTVLDDFDLISPYAEYYDFVGFVDQNGNKYNRINKGTYGNLHLTAIYDPYKYEVTIKKNYENGGTVTGAGIYGYRENVVVEAFPNVGYRFEYFQDSGPLPIAFYTNPTSYTMPHYDICINAYFNLINYNVTYNLDGGTNNSKNISKYTVLTDFEFKEPTKKGYQFLGWYTQAGERITKITPGDYGDLTLYAHWQQIEFNLVVKSENENKGTVEILESGDYALDKVVLSATPAEGYYFDGWYHNNYRLSDNANYEFQMPYKDLTLEARFFDKASFDQRVIDYNEANGVKPIYSDNIIKYGIVPQSLVTDANLKAELDILLTRAENGYFFVDGSYYEKVANKNSWYKCELIRWKVLEEQNEEFYVLCERIIGCEGFSDVTSNFNGSSVRGWLNYNFLNSAFYFDKSAIVPINLDGTESSVIIPSSSEISTSYGFNTYQSRRCSATEFIKARGIQEYGGYSPYWLRDKVYYEMRAAAVLDNGEYDFTNMHCYTRIGVRPIMRLTNVTKVANN